jgi:hypothetical protein
MAQGFVYILVSPNSSYIKIGGTTHPIAKRLKEINGTVSYADHGPWQLSDFLHVIDWQRVEGGLHRYFQERQVRDAGGARELFSVPPHEARTQMRSVGDMLRVDRDTTLRVFKDRDLALYLYRLFNLSGLFGALDIQGAWTLRLLTRTLGGTWFTLNIGSHAVAFSMRNKQKEPPTHYLSVDRLIRDYSETVRWIRKHDGGIEHSPYHKAKHAVQIDFDAGFADAENQTPNGRPLARTRMRAREKSLKNFDSSCQYRKHVFGQAHGLVATAWSSVTRLAELGSG